MTSFMCFGHAEQASSTGPAVIGGGGWQQASCLEPKQAVEFPQVLASLL